MIGDSAGDAAELPKHRLVMTIGSQGGTAAEAGEPSKRSLAARQTSFSLCVPSSGSPPGPPLGDVEAPAAIGRDQGLQEPLLFSASRDSFSLPSLSLSRRHDTTDTPERQPEFPLEPPPEQPLAELFPELSPELSPEEAGKTYEARSVLGSVVRLGNDVALSIALDDPEDVRDTAYLINVPTSSGGVLLATPTLTEEGSPKPSRWLGGMLPGALPSNVESVQMQLIDGMEERPSPTVRPSLQMVGPPMVIKETSATSVVAVALTVKTAVTLAGWALLAIGLLASNSGPVVINLQRGGVGGGGGGEAAARNPLSGRAFLHGAWRGMCSSLVLLSLVVLRMGVRQPARELRLLTRRQCLLLLTAGGAFFVNFGCYNLSLELTSIGHSALFESASSFWLVLHNLCAHYLVGKTAVPRQHLLGVIIGIAGVLTCLADAGSTGQASGDGPGEGGMVAPSAAGDVMALLAGAGSCLYLSLAEQLKTLDPGIFYVIVMLQYGTLSVFAALLSGQATEAISLSEHDGFFGWLLPRPQLLPIQLYTAFVVDFAGNLGYVAVMKYMPALVVVATMLLGPFIATAEGMLLGVSGLPGPFFFVGSTLVILGSGTIAFHEKSRSETALVASVQRDIG